VSDGFTISKLDLGLCGRLCWSGGLSHCVGCCWGRLAASYSRKSALCGRGGGWVLDCLTIATKEDKSQCSIYIIAFCSWLDCSTFFPTHAIYIVKRSQILL